MGDKNTASEKGEYINSTQKRRREIEVLKWVGLL